MDIDEIYKRLIEAGSALVQRQPNLFKYTSETHQTEWNIAHHLANEIRIQFSEFDCDLDITKPNLEKKRPDIVLHKRGTHDHNFLVIEVKRHEENVKEDEVKIREYWFGERLRYRFGAVMVINEGGKPSVLVIENKPT